MAITRIGSGSAEATTITIPANHKQGDILLIFAFWDGSINNPTIPAGWTALTDSTVDGTLCSSSMGWKIATSNTETSGTWTNATGLICHVYRGADPINPFGSANNFEFTSGTTSPSTYQGSIGSGFDRMDNQWLIAFQGHRSIDTTTMNTAPTGYTNVINAQSGVTNNMVSFDTNGPVQAGFALNTVAPGGTASGWMTIQISMWPATPNFNNYNAPRIISAGVMSVTEKIR